MAFSASQQVVSLADGTFSPQEYEEFRVFLEKACGIVLGDNKHYLITSRLSRVMADHKLKSLGDIIDNLKKEPGPRLRESIIEAMTTNETLWFRDVYPFDVLKQKLLPELARKRPRSVRIWSAACSSGQEPYSISMAVQEFLAGNPGALGDVQIVATDISPAILKEAKDAHYDAMALARGINPERKQRFFSPQGNHWEVNPDVRARVRFLSLNLLQSYALLGRFDLVFCRNVLIYFSSESKRDIMGRMAKTLNPGGHLFLGASESITNYSDAYDMVRCNPGVVYKVK
ncbi:MAG: CheR family methyltransferase [Gammaproteobacteria bacterium]